MPKQKIDTPKAPKAIGAYSQGVKVSSASQLLFVSGQIPIDPSTGKLLEGNISVLTRRVLDNIKEILMVGGSNFDQVIRVEVFMTNLKRDFAEMNVVYAQYFNGEVNPTRQTIEVAGLPLGSPIEISCIASIS